MNIYKGLIRNIRYFVIMRYEQTYRDKAYLKSKKIARDEINIVNTANIY